jgi:membrane protease YdiL (CAAX protease family)
MGKPPSLIFTETLGSKDVRRWVTAALLFYGAMAAAAWAWRTGLEGEPLLYSSREDAEQGLRLWVDAGSGAIVAAGLIGASRWLTLRTEAGRALAVELARLLGALRIWQIALLALASGLGEELFFRGALQPRVGLVLASLVFGLVHLLPSWPLALWSLFAVGAGFLFGLLFDETGNLLAPVVAHVLVNAINLRWLVQRYTPGRSPRTC